MDIAKLEGITDAIEVESKIPNPSHQNLARLCAMFMREILSGYLPHPDDPKPLYDTLEVEEIEAPKKSKRKSK